MRSLKIAHYLLFLICMVALSTHAQNSLPPDSLQIKYVTPVDTQTIKSDSNLIFEYIAHPILIGITWPIEKIFIPTLGFGLRPLQPPLQYFARENVLDRVISVISFGEYQRLQIYPVVALAVGQGSMLGFTLRLNDVAPVLDDKAVFQYMVYVDGSQKYRLRYQWNEMIQSKFSSRLGMFLRMTDDMSTPQPGSSYTGFVSDTSYGVESELAHPLFSGLTVSAGSRLRHTNMHNTDRPLAPIACDRGTFFIGTNCLERRGLTSPLWELEWYGSLSQNTIDNENIPTQGSKSQLSFNYHQVENRHDYMEWGIQLQKYFFLGVERYEISPEEQRRMGSLSYQKVMKSLHYENVRKEIFKRKVVVTQLKMSQALDVPGNDMPVYALKSISNGLPMRGYGGSPFKDKAIVAVSMEYRMPLMHMLEGTIFNEYGMYGPDFEQLETDHLVNSWGFGAQVARKDIYLFRVQVGFHGMSYPLFNISVDAAY